MKLYFTIKKNQFLLALILGGLLFVVSLTANFLWQNITLQHVNEQFGAIMSTIWIIIAYLVYVLVMYVIAYLIFKKRSV